MRCKDIIPATVLALLQLRPGQSAAGAAGPEDVARQCQGKEVRE